MASDNDMFDQLSPPTQRKALKLMECAKKIGFKLGSVRLMPLKDFIVYIFTDGTACVIVYCHPAGYLGELRKKEKSEILTEPFIVKNIRNFLLKLKLAKYHDFDIYYANPSRRLSKKEARKIIDSLLTEDDK